MPTILAAGDTVPAFSLPDTDGVEDDVPLAEAAGHGAGRHCLHPPYVIAWNLASGGVAEEYGPRGVRFLGIHANDAMRLPADSLDHMKRFVRDQAGRTRN